PPEEPGIVFTGRRGERLHTGTGAERRTRFVERDMSVCTDTQQLQIEPSSLSDLILVPLAVCIDVRRHAVEYVDVARIGIDVAEQVISHEPVVALLMRARKAYVFVEVERGDF